MAYPCGPGFSRYMVACCNPLRDNFLKMGDCLREFFNAEARGRKREHGEINSEERFVNSFSSASVE